MLQFTLILGLLTLIPACLCGVTTVGEVTVLEGDTITVPCHYEAQHVGAVKYWCQGRLREFCTSLARTDTPIPSHSEEQRVTIFDDQAHQVFTVTMKDSSDGDQGWYWCGVEVGSMWTADFAASLYVKVVHGMSVVNSRVSGEEGSSVNIQCLYSKKFRESQKKWCRSGGWSSCLTTDAEGTYEDTSVAIRDDRDRSFTVTFKKLEMRDTGWYLCGAAQQQMSIHVQVTPRPATTAISLTTSPAVKTVHVPTPKPIAKSSWESHRHIMEFVVVCCSLMLLVAMGMLTRKMWKDHKKVKRLRQAEDLKTRLHEHPSDVGDLQNASFLFVNRDTQQVHII